MRAAAPLVRASLVSLVSLVPLAAIAAGAAITASLAGCAARSTGAPSPRASSLAIDPAREATEAKAFLDDEARALDEIAATDRRFAQRMGATPSDEAVRRSATAALLAEDPDAMVHDGSLDFFSFAARARGLDRAAKIASGASAPPPLRLERVLLDRVLAEEQARLAEERDLPRSASDLVRGIVDTWGPPATMDALKERDTWVGLRLEQLSASLAKSTLPRTELIELDDALDPLERLAAPSDYPSAAAALAKLRVTLGAVTPSPSRAGSWKRIDAGLRAHLGVALAPDEIRARVDRAAEALRALIVARRGRPPSREDPALVARAEPLVLEGGRCDAPPASRVRSLAPPPERAAICGVTRALDEAKDDDALLLALLAMHFDVTAARWTLAVHLDGVDPERAAERTRPLLGLPQEREIRWVRVAAARPVLTLGAALAIEMMTRDASADPRALARRWLHFGDAPLDVVAREVLAARE